MHRTIDESVGKQREQETLVFFILFKTFFVVLAERNKNTDRCLYGGLWMST